MKNLFFTTCILLLFTAGISAQKSDIETNSDPFHLSEHISTADIVQSVLPKTVQSNVTVESNVMIINIIDHQQLLFEETRLFNDDIIVIRNNNNDYLSDVNTSINVTDRLQLYDNLYLLKPF